MFLLCIASAVGSLVLILWARGLAGTRTFGRWFGWFGAAQLVWSVLHAVETQASGRPAKLAWDALQNLPLAAMAVTGLTIAGESARTRAFRGAMRVLAWLAAGIGAFSAAEPLHGLTRTGARVVDGVLTYPYGPADVALAVLAYGGMLVGAATVLVRRSGAHRAHQRRAIALASVISVPVVATCTLMALDVHVDGDRDVSSIAFLLMSVGAVVGFRRDVPDLALQGHAAVLHRLLDAVFVVDARGRVVDANPSGERLIGLPRVLGVEVGSALRAWPEVLALVGSGAPGLAEARGDGKVPAIEAAWTPIADADGVAIGGALTIRDVTERVAARISLESQVEAQGATLERAVSERATAQSALALSEGRLRAIFEQAQHLTGLLDPEGRVIAANRAALRVVGAHLEDVVGMTFWETRWWAQEVDAFARGRDAVARAARGEVVRFQTQYVGRGGATRRFDCSLSPVRDRDEQVLEIVVEAHDVTALFEERERAERLAVQLRQSQKLEALGRLAGGIAHDFNNLLTVIQGNAEMLGGAVDASLRAPVSDLQAAGRAAAEITRQLLTFSRERPHRDGPVALGGLVEAQAGLVRRLVRENIHIHHEVPPDLWPVRGDHAQLQQVLLNLVINAQDAMPEGGHLRIRAYNRPRSGGEGSRRRVAEGADGAEGAGGAEGARDAEDFVVLEVEDDGVGLSADVERQMFEPFFTTKGEGGGTGLGLSMVHGVVYGGGGFIETRSRAPRGTTFTLHFPRAARAAPSSAPPPAESSAPRLTIALVEDMDELRGVVRRMLERAGHRVHAFASPDELLSVAAELAPRPDLLLSDVVLPRMKGPELAVAMQARWPSLRVVLMSGYAPADAPALPEASPLPFLRKPFTAAELRREIASAMSTPTGDGQPRFDPVVAAESAGDVEPVDRAAVASSERRGARSTSSP